MVGKLADYLRVLRSGVPVRRRSLRESETRVVHRDAPKLSSELLDHLAVQETPRRIAVEHHDRAALSLVDIVNPRACTVEPPGLERKEAPIRLIGNVHSARMLPEMGLSARPSRKFRRLLDEGSER